MRRKLKAEEKGKKVYYFTENDIARLKQETEKQVTKILISQLIVIPVKVLNDNFGTLMKKEGREERFANLCLEYLKEVENGKRDLGELIRWLHNVVGIKIE